MERINSRIRSSAVSVGDTATAIPATALPGRNTITVYNNGSVTVYLGDGETDVVTTTNGYPLAAGADKPFDLGDKVTLYGIVATGTCNVRILEGV